jgi:hypothetical protein
MLSSCWPSGVLSSPTRPFVSGARSLARPSPTAYDAADHGPGTNGVGVHPDRGSAILSLACRGSGRSCARHPRSAKAGCQSRQTFLPAVAEGSSIYPSRDRDRQLLPKVEHRQSRYLNNRAENSHRPTRRRERQMQRFKSPEQAQGFLFPHAFIYGHFHPRRHLLTAKSYRAIRTEAFNVWQQETCAQQVA